MQRRRLRSSRSRERVLDEPPVRALLSAGSALPGPAHEVTATLLDEPSVARVAERLARDLASATPLSASPGVLPRGERLAQGGARLLAPLL